MLSLIVATDENNLIGNKNQLPWHLPADLAFFKKNTLNKVIVMGRKTYKSIGKPLPQRRNIVISRDKDLIINGCDVVNTVENAITLLKDEVEVMIIGGMSIYEQSLPLVDRIYLTKIHHSFIGDAYFPKIDDNLWLKSQVIYNEADDKNIYPYTFFILERKL